MDSLAVNADLLQNLGSNPSLLCALLHRAMLVAREKDLSSQVTCIPSLLNQCVKIECTCVVNYANL